MSPLNPSWNKTNRYLPLRKADNGACDNRVEAVSKPFPGILIPDHNNQKDRGTGGNEDAATPQPIIEGGLRHLITQVTQGHLPQDVGRGG